MKITLDLNKEIMVKYARFLGYTEDDLWNINEDLSFVDTITELLEETCEYSMSK